MAEINHDQTIRWLRGLAERQVTASGSRRTFIRLFSNCFEDGSASKDFCIGLENRLRSAINSAKGGE
jgi:hypothetical protein